MAKSKRQELTEKYAGVIAEVSAANGVDEGVALDIVIHEYFAFKGMHDRKHRYYVPAIDWEQFAKDAAAVLK